MVLKKIIRMEKTKLNKIITEIKENNPTSIFLMKKYKINSNKLADIRRYIKAPNNYVILKPYEKIDYKEEQIKRLIKNCHNRSITQEETLKELKIILGGEL